LGALDFAPPSELPGCVQSVEWETAVRDGFVAASEEGAVELDIGGGWTVVYLHVATLDRVPLGAILQQGEHIGHPSCEGGRASGRLLNASLLVAVFFGLDKIAGLGRQILLAKYFGLNPVLDAYNTANNLPDLLFALISGGALAMAFIPVLTETLNRDGNSAAW